MAVGDIVQMSANVDNDTKVTLSSSVGAPSTWATPSSGNLLIAMVWSGGGTITVPSGWTQRYSHTSDANNKRYILEKVSDGTESTLTINFSVTENHGCALYEIEGQLTWDVGTSGYTAGATSVASGTSGTLAGANSLALAVSHHWGVGDTSFDSSFVKDADYDGGNNGELYYLGAAHKAVTGTSALNVTSSWSSSSAGTTTLGVWTIPAAGGDHSLIVDLDARQFVREIR